MDQLDTLANLSELTLLHDLTALAESRRNVSRIAKETQAVYHSIKAEAASLQAHNQTNAGIFEAYAQNAQHRLAALKSAQALAEAATEASLQTALHAQGRVKAIEMLQRRALAERQALAARREEVTNMGRIAALAAQSIPQS